MTEIGPSVALDWESRYREGTTPWERPSLNPALRAWQALGVFAPPCRVLLPGAGRSAEPAALAEAGCAVTVVDLADSAVIFQRARLGAGGDVVQADLLDWQPGIPFDVVYDQTCLCALPPTIWPAYERSLHGWLRPGGHLAILFMQSQKFDGPPYHCDLPAMRRLFEESRWTWPDALPHPEPHHTGFSEQPALLVRR